MTGTVAPSAGAWIEITGTASTAGLTKSSLPPRERGLKYSTTPLLGYSVVVAPSAGAWIEMPIETFFTSSIRSLPPRERGLKYVVAIGNVLCLGRRSLRGSVD